MCLFIAFYNELSFLVRSISKHNVLVIGGDINAQIGKNVNYKFSLHNSSNRNREHLTDFMQENRLTCLTKKFQKTEGKQWTYTDANDTKAQTDYVIINKINGVIAHWITRHILLSTVCPSITELSRQKRAWAWEEIQPEQQPLHTMTCPY